MQALGFIETKGLLAAIECADTMVKSADVTILEKVYVGGGLVTVSVTGDVGAVKAAVEAGVASVKKLNESFLVSENVIPRPHEDLSIIFGEKTVNSETEYYNSIEETQIDEDKQIDKETNTDEETNINEETQVCEKIIASEKVQLGEHKSELNNNLDSFSDLNSLKKHDIDSLFKVSGIDATIEVLSKLKLSKLRNLAREYKDFNIKGRTISKADKGTLINEFKLYYK